MFDNHAIPWKKPVGRVAVNPRVRSSSVNAVGCHRFAVQSPHPHTSMCMIRPLFCTHAGICPLSDIRLAFIVIPFSGNNVLTNSLSPPNPGLLSSRRSRIFTGHSISPPRSLSTLYGFTSDSGINCVQSTSRSKLSFPHQPLLRVRLGRKPGLA